MDNEHIQKIETEISELRKHSIDWRFITTAFVPVFLVVGGSLISIAIQVNMMSERLNSLNSLVANFNTINARELDKLSTRLDRLEQQIYDGK